MSYTDEIEYVENSNKKMPIYYIMIFICYNIAKYLEV